MLYRNKNLKFLNSFLSKAFFKLKYNITLKQISFETIFCYEITMYY